MTVFAISLMINISSRDDLKGPVFVPIRCVKYSSTVLAIIEQLQPIIAELFCSANSMEDSNQRKWKKKAGYELWEKFKYSKNCISNTNKFCLWRCSLSELKTKFSLSFRNMHIYITRHWPNLKGILLQLLNKSKEKNLICF